MSFAGVGGGVWMVSRDGLIEKEKLRWISEDREEFARSAWSVGGIAGRRRTNAKAWAVLGEGIPAQGGWSCRMQEGEGGLARKPRANQEAFPWQEVTLLRSGLCSSPVRGLLWLVSFLVPFPASAFLPAFTPDPFQAGVSVACVLMFGWKPHESRDFVLNGWPYPQCLALSHVIEFGLYPLHDGRPF